MRIAVEHLGVRLDGATILGDLSFAFAGPGWLGIVGANGSGKTTLLRALCGRLPLDRGTIRLDNDDLTRNRSLRAARLALAPEERTLPTSLTGRQLLTVAAGRRWQESDDALTPLRPLYEALGLARFLDRRIAGYSAGMRQRLAIFCPFMTGAHTILLDEPFNWLDPVAAYDVKAELRRLSRAEYTIVSALHELSSLYRLCDEGLLMAEGAIRLHLPFGRLLASEQGVEAFERDIVRYLREGQEEKDSR